MYVKLRLVGGSGDDQLTALRTSTCHSYRGDPSWRMSATSADGLVVLARQVKPGTCVAVEVWEEDVYCGGEWLRPTLHVTPVPGWRPLVVTLCLCLRLQML